MAGLILALREIEPPGPLVRAIREGRIAGLLWFRGALPRDAGDARRVVDRVRALWPAGCRPLFVLDEEGGLIQQLSEMKEEGGEEWARLPAPRAVGRCDDETLAYEHGREIGRRIRRVGLDGTLAPCIDLDPGPASPVLGTRCFGSDPDRVAALALAWARGLASAGAVGCLKHYPGHGATTVDSHADLPRIDLSVPQEPHRRPYAAVARAWRSEDGPAPGILTAHIRLGDNPLPASLDAAIIAARPRGLGPVFTDALDMGALLSWGDAEERARRAAEAGNDYLVFGIDLDAGLAAARSIDPGSPFPVFRGDRERPSPRPITQSSLERLAAAGARAVERRPLPGGEWTWLLPERFGPYGEVGAPALRDPQGRRRIGRIVRYPGWDSSALAAAIETLGRDRPILGGVIQRGLDAEVEGAAAGRYGGLAALVHLLDAPPASPPWGIWRAESCGFGPHELEAVRRLWAAEEEGKAD